MFAFNGVSPMDESLAFHVSTNTFNNPAFDQDHIESSADLPASPLDHRAEINQKKKKKEDRKRSFGDGLVFAIRSKLFVIDVNFRRKFNSLREFAARHLPALFEKKQRSATTSDKRMFANSRTRNSNKIHDSSSREQFWENILVEPSSRKSLGKQKAKILNRLEQALEQKRTQQQRKETSEAQQQQHQQADGLRQIRPGILGHPLYHSYHPPTSPQPALQRPLHGGVQPLLIGSQHWATKQQQQQTREGKRSVGSKWKQIRDIVFDDEADATAAAAADEGAASSGKKLCIVCYTNTPNIVTLPCKHHDVCSDCFIEMIYIAVKKSQYPLKCALCRQKVEKIRCSRKLLLSVIEKQRIYP